MTLNRSILVSLVVACSSLAACGEQAQSDRAANAIVPTSIAAATTPTAPIAAVPVTTRTSIAGDQYVLDPAPGAKPTADLGAILQGLSAPSTMFGPYAASSKGTTVKFGAFRDNVNYPKGKSTLAYAITFAQVECVPTSPAPSAGSGAVAVPVQPVPCNVTVIVDALSGQTIMSIEGT